MSKTIVGILIALLVVAGVVAAVMVGGNEKAAAPEHEPTSQTEHTDESEVTPATTQTKTAQTSSSTAATEGSVTIRDYAFSPNTIKVKVGSTVTWTNQDDVRHDVTPDQETDDFEASNLLDKGESYSVKFTKPGTYSYYCSPHPYMKATVEVVE